MKQLLSKAMGLLALLLSIGYVQAQSLTPAEPIRPNSGNVDAANYDAVKAQFVAEHPEQYGQMNGAPAKVVTENQNSLPWGSPENKTQWISTHPTEYAEMNKTGEDFRTRITRAQFDAYPAEKQQAVLNDQNILIID
jgi:hypothetical protein